MAKQNASGRDLPGRIKLYAPLSTPAIGIGDEIHKVADDGTITVPEWRKAEFLATGCTEEPPE